MNVNFWEEEIMGQKKDVMITFKSCEPFAIWLSSAVTVLDRSKSEVIRTCVILALPTIMANPRMLDHVCFDDVIDGGKNKS
jgi:hypothetical protein